MPLLLLQNAVELEALGGLFEKIGGMPTIMGGLLLLLAFPVVATGAIGFVLWRVTDAARKERETAADRDLRAQQERDAHYERVFGAQASALSDLAVELREMRESMEEGRVQRMQKDGEVIGVLQGMQRELASIARRVEDIERNGPAQPRPVLTGQLSPTGAL